MENENIERKLWNNNAAFIEVDPNTLEVKVYGKFQDGSWFSGPSTGVLGKIPEHLFNQAKGMVRLFWSPIPETEEYAELRAFCADIYEKAKKANSWFSY